MPKTREVLAGVNDAYDTLSGTFAGRPPADDIRRLMEPLLGVYNTAATEANRVRAGAAITKVSGGIGLTEMELLAYMGRHPAPGTTLTFSQAAALFSVSYRVDYPLEAASP